MATVREKLKEMHTAQAEHHLECAKCYKTLSDSFSKADGFSDVSETYQNLAKEHTRAGARCVEMAKALAGDLEKSDLMPTDALGIIPSDVPIKAVPRFGQPGSGFDKAKGTIPENLAKLVSVPEE